MSALPIALHPISEAEHEARRIFCKADDPHAHAVILRDLSYGGLSVIHGCKPGFKAGARLPSGATFKWARRWARRTFYFREGYWLDTDGTIHTKETKTNTCQWIPARTTRLSRLFRLWTKRLCRADDLVNALETERHRGWAEADKLQAEADARFQWREVSEAA